MFNDGLAIKEGCSYSDGVNVKLVKNADEQIWPKNGWKTIEYGETDYIEDVYVDVEVGDILRFRVNCNVTQTGDTLLFSPEVRYTEIEPIWNEPVISKNNGKINIALEAQSPSAENSCVIVMLKTGSGIFKKAYIAEKNVTGGKTLFHAENIEADEADKILLFFWKSLFTCAPLREALPLE